MLKSVLRSLVSITSCLPSAGNFFQAHKIRQFVASVWVSSTRLAASVASDSLQSTDDGRKPLSKHPHSVDRLPSVSASDTTAPVRQVIRNTPSPKVDFYRRTLPRSCISFTSDEGKEIFRESLIAGDMNCYFQLASQYRTQDEPAFCGLSTLVMVLNTLEIDPKKVWKGPWRWYHENMLDCCIPLAVVEKTGITMDQFACLAACNMLSVKMIRTDQSASEESFRALVRAMVRHTDKVLVVTYSREVLDQTGDGHFSPIGGYNSRRDMVLIMDTARFKYPPHWVSLSVLFQAMKRIDEASGLPRGYFLLSKSDISPGLIFRLSNNFSPLYLQNKDSKINVFIKSWERLLMTTTVVSDDSTAIVELAVSQLLVLLDGLDSDTFLLTAEVDPAYADELSSQYGHDIRRLLSLVESLQAFRIVSEGVLSGRFSQISLLKAGIPGRGSPSLSNSGWTSSSSAGLPCMKLNLNLTECITPSHFLTMLVLAWPYHRCSREKLCTELHRYTSTLLSRPGTELLQNEAARLKQQLTSILSYSKSCCHGECQ